ncbi:hypothetical protein H1Z61_04870 [Bacillus aquiflavi]|uniref:LXG domain-containing protein n=1 Tax=Bacillus aquiflavi TaxID=2672567 RepID=A0A6B3VYN3_9BACI|nr:T7SS effector LXG polymorphic toxin [Bacillus aquiflavi]MBA4536496.1 hypothetical protein [Bacillus aquiflavi]NEY80863.1 hypothetical protein [Bacillus aquiflavi]UAC47382.1 LXG domain-containing protein [Bacillus aquiflavi]
MGLRVAMSEMHQQINDINKILQSKNNAAYRLLTAIETFSNDSLLKGRSYEVAKEYMRDVYLPLIKGIIRANEEIIEGNKFLISRFQAQVDPSPSAIIDTDKLHEMLLKINTFEGRLNSLKEDNFHLFKNVQEQIFETKKMVATIQRLYAFNSNNASLHMKAQSILANIEVGLHMISQGTWDDFAHSFKYKLTDMKWAKSIHNEWEYKNLTAEEEFDKHLQEEFGFGEEEVKLMNKLQEKLKERFPYASSEELDWYFTRLIGGFSYGGSESSSGDHFKWNATAGDPYTVLPQFRFDEKDFFTIFLGFSEDEYKLLRYKVRVQNQIVSLPKENSLVFLEKNNRINMYKASLEDAIGKELTDTEFKIYWNEQYNRMVTKGDFAHQQITTATMLNNRFVLTDMKIFGLGIGKEKKEDLAGWLGDATIGEPPSFGKDDYIADLDAENIYYLIKEKQLSYQAAVNKYYKEVGIKYTRAELFTKHTTVENVKKQIFAELKVSNLDELKSKAPDSYRFIRSLEENMNEMGEFK